MRIRKVLILLLSLTLILLNTNIIAKKSSASLIKNQGKKNQRKIIATGKKLQKKISNQYNAFLKELGLPKKLKAFSMPIKLSRAKKIVPHNIPPGEHKLAKVYAYLKRSITLKGAASRMAPNLKLVLKKNTKVEVVFQIKARGDDLSWCLIRTAKKKEGFVLSQDLQHNAIDNNNLRPANKTSNYRVIANDGLNMRTKPSGRAKKILTLAYGSKVQVLKFSKHSSTYGKKTGLWAKVKFRSKIGWVFSPYLKKTSGNDSNDSSKKSTKSKKFKMPIKGRITSRFGGRIDPISGKRKSFHAGIDIAAKRGTPIHAAADGKIVKASRSRGYGNLTIISHGKNVFTYYAHQQKFRMYKNQTIKKGTVLGYVGTTGRSTGPHLHFEVRRGKRAINPRSWLFR